MKDKKIGFSHIQIGAEANGREIPKFDGNEIGFDIVASLRPALLDFIP